MAIKLLILKEDIPLLDKMLSWPKYVRIPITSIFLITVLLLKPFYWFHETLYKSPFRNYQKRKILVNELILFPILWAPLHFQIFPLNLISMYAYSFRLLMWLPKP